ncbi:uncharacterized protein TRIADDRAFT_30409, partial [Trichoplax adhaerens]
TTLRIQNVSLADAANYTCSVENLIGTHNFTAIVTVRNAPKILLNPSNTTIVEGDRIELQCTGTSLPIFSVTWLKNNQPTTSDFTTYTNASSTNRTATLVIFSANIGDDGFYQCKLTNRLGNITSMASRVEVQFAPRIITELTSSSQSVIENSAIILNCQANANPVPTFTWYKDGIEINRTTYLSTSYNQSQILLTNVTEMDAGSYNCTSTNLIGSASSNMDITVYIPTAPPSNVSTIPISGRLISVAWLPPPISDQNGVIVNYNISYYSNEWKHGDTIQVSGNTTSLLLEELIPHTNYSITVKAATIIGFGPASIGIVTRTPQIVPSAAPANVRATTISARSISVTWLPPPKSDQNGVITNYNIAYYSSKWSHGGEIQVSGNITMLVIDKLIAYSDYNVTVKASTIIGFGPKSIGIITRTLQAVPSSPPTNVSIIPISARSISVSWQPPPISDQNGIITNYSISYYSTKRSHGGEMQVSSETASFVIRQLIPYTDYNITVKASTIIGFGPYSMGILTRTLQAVPSAPPTNVSIIPISARSISVSWLPPPISDQNGIITNYSISYYSSQRSHGGEIQVSGNITLLVIRQLIPYTDYNITVKASTIIGFGPYSIGILTRTLQAGKYSTLIASLSYSFCNYQYHADLT